MLRRRLQQLDPIVALTVLLVAIAAVMLTLTVAETRASSGGVGLEDSRAGKPGKAKLVDGKAIPPANAPERVVAVIEAANEIRNKPYKWGGGHGSWKDRGYDCSGAVSYALHGGRMLKSPLASGDLMRWGNRGKGDWITVYAHGGHVYAVIAGLRWDTSMTPGDGPGWSKQQRSSSGFTARHYNKY
jgi:cell wall-associated NlpC family hydrolase